MALNSDYLKFKDEVLKDIREFEKRITEEIKSKDISIYNDLESIHGQLGQIIVSNKTINKSLIEYQMKFNNINELEEFKKKNENNSLVFDIKLNQAIGDMEKTKSKYDKIIGDNLTVPGIVGGNSKFKNIREYIINNNQEINKLKSELENQKRQNNELKKKIEQINKNLLNIMESNIKQSTQLLENNKTKFQKLLEQNTLELNDKIIETKTDNIKRNLILEEKINKLIDDFKGVPILKNEILEEINKKIEEKQKYLEENIEKNKMNLINSMDAINLNISKNDKKIMNINSNIELIKEQIRINNKRASFSKDNNNNMNIYKIKKKININEFNDVITNN